MARFTIEGITLEVPDALLTKRIASKLSSGTYESDERRAALMRLRPGERVLELGAGLGFVAASCAGVTGAENVIAVEANPDLIPVLRDTLARNGHAGAEIVHGAISDADNAGAADVSFDASGAFWAGHIATGEEASDPAVIQVPRLSLTTLFERYEPALVVMDIEGAEAHLFDAPWPGYVRLVVMELHPKRYPDRIIQRIVDTLSASGLTYDPGPSIGRILCFRRLRGD
ncbi:MAG: FkbM family methyltransferase [Pseudomonadota bacterium]